MDNRLILATVIGILIGLYVYDLFLAPEIETKVEITEVRTTDTLWLPSIPELIFLRSPKPLYLRDTIINELIYPVNSYSGLENTLYGQIKWQAETSGFLNKLDLSPEFKLPVITNTIDKTKTITNTVMTKGFYSGASINSLMQPSITAAYQDKDYIFDYSFTPSIQLHAIGVKRRIF
jgi:hypothetical protein